jgi:hypothetical protein
METRKAEKGNMMDQSRNEILQAPLFPTEEPERRNIIPPGNQPKFHETSGRLWPFG